MITQSNAHTHIHTEIHILKIDNFSSSSYFIFFVLGFFLFKKEDELGGGLRVGG